MIPICGAKESPALLAAAYDQISTELSHGEVVCIFPEGKITRTSELDQFRTGVERIVQRNPVTVVPGDPIAPENVRVDSLRAAVLQIMETTETKEHHESKAV